MFMLTLKVIILFLPAAVANMVPVFVKIGEFLENQLILTASLEENGFLETTKPGVE